MSDQKQPPANEPKQKTLKGYEIPATRRGEIFAAFKKIVARPRSPGRAKESASGPKAARVGYR
jgi:hypothetical protein